MMACYLAKRENRARTTGHADFSAPRIAVVAREESDERGIYGNRQREDFSAPKITGTVKLERER
jgi:hypothetical protein